MQIPKISKLFPAICAVVFCSSLMVIRAADTPAQAAARAALLEKLNEMPAQPSAPPVTVTSSNAVVEAPAPVVVAPPAAPAPAPAPSTEMFLPAPAPVIAATPAVDSDAQAKARAAVLQKLSELQEQPVATPAPAPEKIVVQQPETPPAAAPVAAPVVIETPPAMVAEPMVKPMETPALPIAATKEERLQALLEKYKADQITPAEYHTERAKIIAEP